MKCPSTEDLVCSTLESTKLLEELQSLYDKSIKFSLMKTVKRRDKGVDKR